MLRKFRAKKENVLRQLLRPDEEYTDASPKGSVDDGVRDLVRDINDVDGFVTLSSCSGRIAVYLDGPPKQETATHGAVEANNVQPTNVAVTPSASTGGKGGGRWLFHSHSPVDLEQFSNEGALFRRFGMAGYGLASVPPAECSPQFVHFKFEPMLLALMASSHEQAQDALSAAMTAGFRESGIGGLYDSKSRPTAPMVTVRSSGLALDCIIGYKLADTPVTPMVSEGYLRSMIRLANDRFEMNETRKARFKQAFFERAGMPNSMDEGGIETERRREAGTRRKHYALHIGGALDGPNEHGTNQHDFDEDDEYGFDMFMTEHENEDEDEDGEGRKEGKTATESNHTESINEI